MSYSNTSLLEIMNHGSTSGCWRPRNRVRWGKKKQRKRHKTLKPFPLLVKWWWLYSGTAKAQFIGNLGMKQTPTLTLWAISGMLSSSNAQICSSGNHVYSMTMPNFIPLIWSRSCLRTLNGKCSTTFHILAGPRAERLPPSPGAQERIGRPLICHTGGTRCRRWMYTQEFGLSLVLRQYWEARVSAWQMFTKKWGWRGEVVLF